MPTYLLGYDVLEIEPNDDGNRQAEYTRSAIRHDSRTGGLVVVDRAEVAIVRHPSFLWTMDGRAEVHEYRDWVEARRGALVPFWVPTWRHDLIMAANLVSGTSLSIVNTSYDENQFADPARQHLAFLLADGTKYYREVTNAVEIDEDTETLTISATIPVSVTAATTMVSFLTLCRLATDDPELVWHSRFVAEANLQFVELPAEVAEIDEGS